jgi:hypothetical protein
MSDDREPRGWTLAEPPVFRGPLSPRTLTLDVLSRPLVRESLEHGIGSRLDVGPDEAVRAVARLATRAVACAVLAPYVVDGVALAVEPAQVGVDLDVDLVARWTWLGRAVPLDEADPEMVGASIAALLEPVLVGASRIPGGSTVALVDEELREVVRGLQQNLGCRAEPADIARLLAVVADGLSGPTAVDWGRVSQAVPA